MALDFPSSPTVNQKYPASPVNGVPTYTWDGEKWTTVGGSMPGVGGGDPPGTATPLGDITPAVVGVATKYAREDHRHPVDTSIANKVAKAGDVMTGNLTINTTAAFSTDGQLVITNSDGGGVGVVIDGYHNSASPAAGDVFGVLRFRFNDSGATKRDTQINFGVLDPTAGADSTYIAYVVRNAGAGIGYNFYPTWFGAGVDNTQALGQNGNSWASLWLSGSGPYTIATAANYLANTAKKLLTSDVVWAAAAPVVSGTSASLTPDFSTAIDFQWTYSSTTAAVNNGTNLKVGQKGVIYIIAGSAGCVITTWGSQYKFPGGTKPTMSLTNGAIDAISYTILSSTQILCSFQGAFA